MIESRCGLLCSECRFFTSGACAGCTRIDKPFWGERCPVKSCAEGKRHAHCGACGEFPCAVLHGFAYDEKEGDDGARIERCRAWQREEKA